MVKFCHCHRSGQAFSVNSGKLDDSSRIDVVGVKNSFIVMQEEEEEGEIKLVVEIGTMGNWDSAKCMSQQ